MLRPSSRGIQKLRRAKRKSNSCYEKMMKTLLLQNQQIIIQQQNMMFMVMKQCHQQSPSSPQPSTNHHQLQQHQQNLQHHNQQQQQHMPATGQLTIIHGQQEPQHTQITLSGHSQQQQHPAIHQLQPHSEPSHLSHQEHHHSQSQSHIQQQPQQQNLSTPPTPANHGQRSNGSSQQQQQQQQQQHHHQQQQSQIMHQNHQQTHEQEHSIHHQFVGHHQNGNTDATMMETHKQLQQVASHLQDSLGSYLTPAASEQDPISDGKSTEEDLTALLENDGLLTNNLLYNPQTDIGSVTPYKNHQHQQQTPSYYSSGCESLTTPRVEQPRQSTTNISQNVVKNLADSFKSPTKPKINVQILSNSATRNMKNSKAKIIQTMNISEFLRQVHHDEGPKSSQ